MTPTDTQKAYDLIKERIVTTGMAPGAVIHESALISELKLGRTPIREALKLLEAEKLVTVSPRRGMFVTSINISDLTHIQEIRSVLDLLCVRLAAMRITPPEVAELRELVDRSAACFEAKDTKALLELDQRFHSVLARSTRNELLRAELEMLYSLSLRIWYFYLDHVVPEDLAFEALAEVVDALESHEPQRAEQAMYRHILHFADSIKKLL